ncbi:hypothetical protein [Salinibacillus xinjiangensis]|uniref:Uncharacterized protein n=1 Tax=Salinibacillus xinjiangensis TaxID=1229268 RepID=A0A6G1X677_9BACI|nr:hypothetical protein [Salinibacillus xinjiangensis]MRG86318.1 hypothetical protein [Salinibacillus xinjiangensis]
MELTQAMAYTTIAMKKLGYSKREIESITNTMLDEYKHYDDSEVEGIADEILFNDEQS